MACVWAAERAHSRAPDRLRSRNASGALLSIRRQSAARGTDGVRRLHVALVSNTHTNSSRVRVAEAASLCRCAALLSSFPSRSLSNVPRFPEKPWCCRRFRRIHPLATTKPAKWSPCGPQCHPRSHLPEDNDASKTAKLLHFSHPPRRFADPSSSTDGHFTAQS